MTVFTDQLGDSISLQHFPQRIISLVPSQTELLFYLGLHDRVVGVTKFCVHPQEWVNQKIKVGGTKQVNIEVVKELRPDLIIANKEENTKEDLDALKKDFPVWISDVNDIPGALDMIRIVGEMTGSSEKANTLIAELSVSFAQLVSSPPVKTAYLIWRKPYMAAGSDTFINAMLTWGGFENVFAHLPRYPLVTIQQLIEANCDVILLSSEPFPFAQKHVDELHPLLRDTRMLLVDGEMFSWYGNRLLLAPAYIRSIRNAITINAG